MGRENTWENLQERLTEQTNLCKLETNASRLYLLLFHAPITWTTDRTFLTNSSVSCIKRKKRRLSKLAKLLHNIRITTEVLKFMLRSDQRSPSSHLNYLKYIAIDFKLPNKAVLKSLQSSIKIDDIKHRYSFFNQHLAQ